jgi:hypothetical protein
MNERGLEPSSTGTVVFEAEPLAFVRELRTVCAGP